jgi:hypothetical protein
MASRYADSMRFMALASDYDGTLAHDGNVNEQTVEALLRFRQSGRLLILVTGRELADFEAIFPQLNLFHRIVAENGAVLYNAETREKRRLAEPPPREFIDALHKRGVLSLSVGDVIVATSHPHESVVLETIRDLGLELNVIFNKGAVMILPAGVNKRTGLKAALDELSISEHNTAGVGDAENDHAFLSYCECGVAVANALPAVKETADLVMNGDHGAGVVELIDRILKDDLASAGIELKRHDIVIGHDGPEEILVPAHGSNVLVSGASGSGKSTFTKGFLESLQKREYQVCLIDPEGDYASVQGAIAVGDEKTAASEDQAFQALQKPSSQVVVSLVGIPIGDRPSFFARFLPRLQDMRLRTGRPHWIIIDEAHHMLPADPSPGAARVPPGMRNILLITVHPEHVAPTALRDIDIVVAVGASPDKVLQEFARIVETSTVQSPPGDLASGEAIVWFRKMNRLRTIRFVMPEGEHNRHKRKYAHGEIEPDRSFHFTGRQNQFKLRAQNLQMFLQLAEGLDDDTWNYHLKRGDYSRWFREGVKDEELARDVEAVENNDDLDAAASRLEIKRAIENRYTAPA